MSAADGWVADFQTVNYLVSFRTAVPVCSHLVAEFKEVVTLPTFHFVEAVHYGPAQCLAANILGDIAWCEKRTVLVAIYLLKNLSQHRCIDDSLAVLSQRILIALFLYTKVKCIKKAEQVVECRQRTFHSLTVAILDSSLRHHFHFAQPDAADGEILLLKFRLFKQGTIQIGHILKCLSKFLITLFCRNGQHFHEQVIQDVIVWNTRANQQLGCCALIEGEQLRLQQFQEQKPIDPNKYQSQCRIKQVLLFVEVVSV